MRHEYPGDRLHVDNPFSERVAEGPYHHGFHGGPILWLAIGLVLIVLAWVIARKTKQRRTDITHMVTPAFVTDEHSVLYTASSAQRAAALDRWERNILKEDK